jgi:phthalate 3,4-dioxygenase subunit beta
MPAPLPYTAPTYGEILDFAYNEAAALDERRHHDWLAMLTDDVVYRMPVRVTTAHSLDDSLLVDMAHFDEDRYSLVKRVERLDTEHAWAEDPPSRTRRFVTNVRGWQGNDVDELLVAASVLLFRSRGDRQPPDLISAGRHDTLRRVGGQLKLARRDLAVDESVLRTQNLAVFL